MLWHVDKTNFHILGSVHVSNRPLPISAETVRVLNRTTVLAFEANFDAAPNLAPAHYKADDSLSKNIPEPLFSDARRLWLELGLSREEFERLRPWLAAFRLMNAVLSSRGFTGEQGIDRRVLDLGKKDNKTLFFLDKTIQG
mgnify:FL=1